MFLKYCSWNCFWDSLKMLLGCTVIKKFTFIKSYSQWDKMHLVIWSTKFVYHNFMICGVRRSYHYFLRHFNIGLIYSFTYCDILTWISTLQTVISPLALFYKANILYTNNFTKWLISFCTLSNLYLLRLDNNIE